jgi:hypothetical protein
VEIRTHCLIQLRLNLRAEHGSGGEEQRVMSGVRWKYFGT